MPGESLRDLALSPDGARIVVSTWQSKLLVFERRGEALVATVRVSAPTEMKSTPVSATARRSGADCRSSPDC